MKKYESVFIVPPDLSTDRLDEIIEKLKQLVEKHQGIVSLVEKWGRRRLAYQIKRYREGFYVFWKFSSGPAALPELNKFYRVSDDVIRHLVCNEVKANPTPAPKPSPEKAEGEATPAPAAPAPAATAPAAPSAAPAAVETKEAQ